MSFRKRKIIRLTESNAVKESFSGIQINSFLLESSNLEGSVWKIMVIEEGMSKNGLFYSADVLKEAIPLFEGVKVFAYEFSPDFFNHLPDNTTNPKGFPKCIAGWVEGIKFETIGNKKGLTGDFHVTDNFFRETFKNAWEHGKKDLLGFSIDASGEYISAIIDGKQGKKVTKIHEANSVDIVTFPAAGGKMLRLIASKNKLKGADEMKEKLIKMIAAMVRENPDMLTLQEGQKLEDLDDKQVFTLLMSSVKESEPEKKEDPEKEEDPEKKESEKEPEKEEDPEKKEDPIQEAEISEVQMAKVISQLNDKKIDEALGFLKGLMGKDKKKKVQEAEKEDIEAKLNSKVDEKIKQMDIRESDMLMTSILSVEEIPQDAKDKIQESFKGKVFSEKELRDAIKGEREYLAKFVESKGMDSGTLGIQGGRNKVEKMQAALDLMCGYEPEDNEKEMYEGIKPFRGLKEAYYTFTGDAEVRGVVDEKRLTEALSTDFPLALGVSMEKRMVKEYKRLQIKESWNKLVNIENVDNFKTQTIIRWGGLGNLPAVAEAAAYTSYTSPSEESSTYSASKKGKLLSITREMIKNDDMRTMRIWPAKLAQSANRTLAIFVFDLLLNYASGAINGGTIYDSLALYHATHANLVTSNLGYNSVDAAITAMANQAEADSSEALGIQAQFLVVPYELRATAKVLINSEKRPLVATTNGTDTGTIESANPVYKALEPIIIPKAYLRSDQNNWYVVANPKDVETIALGFVDGRQDPEILLQDNPTVATVFTNDQIKYKIRHEYGGAVVDYRGFYAGIPTGIS